MLKLGFSFVVSQFCKNFSLNCLYLINVVPIFLWARWFTGWAILGNGQVEFTGWENAHPVNLLFTSLVHITFLILAQFYQVFLMSHLAGNSVKKKLLISSRDTSNWRFCKTIENKGNFSVCLALSKISVCEFQIILPDCITAVCLRDMQLLW